MRSWIGAFARDDRGAWAVTVALMMPIIVGGLALGGETGYWYFTQRKLQTAADIAAHAGAVQLRSGRSQAVIEASALEAAVEAGYRAPIGTLNVSAPPVSGSYAGNDKSVEVVVQETVPLALTSVLLDGDVPISARAVANLSEGRPVCVLALDRSAGAAVNFTGNADYTFDNCDIAANSIASDAVNVGGSSAVLTSCVSAVGGITADAGLTMSDCIAPLGGQAIVADIYAGLMEPPIPASCDQNNARYGGPAGRVYDISPGRYCGGMIIQREVNMAPGVYVIDGGDFDVGSTAIVSGTGVTIFLTGGATTSMNANAQVTLTAPAAGDFAGMLLWSDNDDPYANYHVNGGLSSQLNGVIYIPNGHLLMNGASGVTGGCTKVVARTIEFSGNTEFGSDCSALGVPDQRAGQLVLLVE